ncbi:beta-lactamase family protein [Archangium gephyra]|uniref:serine hydrolase domain-containing protein n=1 Tax=Archangium gephyra TaxID=48 RepID=UPI0035D4C2FE
MMSSVLGGCATFGKSLPTPLPPPVTDTLQNLLDETAATMQAPGMVMAVQIGNSKPWIGVTGCLDNPCTKKMKPDATFRLGSITKNFVGMAILQQVGEGKISLDDTLEKWLPGVIPNIDGNAITIRQLMNHTSGIESFTNSPQWIITLITDRNHLYQQPQDLLTLAGQLRAESIAANAVLPPGSPFSYSNTHAILLGMIAAKVDGLPVTDWNKVIENRFLKPLHLKHTFIPGPGELGIGSNNHGYVNLANFVGAQNCAMAGLTCEDKLIDFTEQNVTNAAAAGSLVSNAEDLLKWMHAELKGNLLSPQVRQQQQAFIDTGLPGLQVGLSIFKQTQYGFIGHRGEIFGFNGTMQYLPSKDMTVIVLSNRTALDGIHVGAVPEQVAAALFPDLGTTPQQLRLMQQRVFLRDPPHIKSGLGPPRSR